MKTKTIVSDLVRRATRTRYAGATVAERVALITGRQKEQLRSILVRSLRRGEAPDAMVRQVQRFYRGIDGHGGPAAMARRLVQSEVTRFNGRVAVKVGERINQETGKVPVFTYQTQQDDAVRDEHALAQDLEFTLDDLADATDYAPVSEAEALLSDVNCRCWLDVDYA